MLDKNSLKWLAAFGTLALGLTGCAQTPPLATADAPAAAQWPSLETHKSADAALERRIAEIVAGMTLRQKIGQMTQADIRSITPQDVRENYIGSVLNGGGAWPGGKKHATAGDWIALSNAYYQASMATDMKVQVPIIWGTDAVHGHNNVFGATLFPHNIALGAAHDANLVGRIARLTAKQVRATGIQWAFAPTLAVVQNPRWGRTYESYSSDPELVRSYSRAFVSAMQRDLTGPDATLATAKHFIGDGGTWLGKDQGEARASLADLIKVHAPGYYGALEADVQTVMISYSSWTDIGSGTAHGKMHGNRELITDVLKGKLGFDGLVVSDWNAIEQVDGCTRTNCPQAINAGVDLIMVPDDWRQFIDETVAEVEAGVIPMSRIDDAVSRILRVKLRSGLFDTTPVPAPQSIENLSSDEARATAREAVAKSIVLLKNTSASHLPLAASSKILVVGRGGQQIPLQLGGWSMTWQGDETDNADYPQADSLLSALRKSVSDAGRVDYSEDGKGVDVTAYDAVIVVHAENPYAEMKGDVSFPATMRHSARYPQDLAALQRVSGKGVPVISVLYSGRPVYANDLMNLSDAFVAAWLPGTEALGITDVLLRRPDGSAAIEFNGRLSFAWPSDPCPDTATDPVLFARGFGLHTSDRVESKVLPVDDRLTCPAPAE